MLGNMLIFEISLFSNGVARAKLFSFFQPAHFSQSTNTTFPNFASPSCLRLGDTPAQGNVCKKLNQTRKEAFLNDFTSYHVN